MNPVRAVCLILFLFMMFWMRELAHFIVGLGWIAWLLAMAAIFTAGIVIENRSRRPAGDAPYSWSESRELILPICAMAIIFAIAYLVG